MSENQTVVKVTSEDVKAYLLGELKRCRAGVPGMLSLSVTANDYCPLVSEPSVKIGIYCNICGGHSPHFQTIEAAVDYQLGKAGGKTESAMVRATAAELVAKAEALEASGK